MTGAEADLEHVRLRLMVGAPVDAAALPQRARRALEVARAAGAPALPALDAAVAAADDLSRRDRAVVVATAQARMVMGGLVALPIIAVPGLSVLTGMPLWRFYVTSSGAVVGVVGAVLVLASVAIARRMVASVVHARTGVGRATATVVAAGVVALLVSPLAALPVAAGVWWRWRRRPGEHPGGIDEVPELLATALSGGLSHGGALRLVAAHVSHHGSELRRAALALELGAVPQLSPPLDRVAHVLSAAAAWGAPAVPALHRVARQSRDEELARVLAAAERLPAMLTFPAALCSLPACLLLVGAPLVAEGLRAATAG